MTGRSTATCRGCTQSHCFAVTYVARGGDIYKLSRLLGHASMTTTQRYLRSMGFDTINEGHQRLSPLSPLTRVREHYSDVVLVVIDTLAQHMDGSEDNADMNAALKQCQYIRDELDTTVLVMHHPTKADATVERGGSSFRAGCADVLTVAERGGTFILTAANTRDRDTHLAIPYELEVVTIEGILDDDGQPFTSCVPKVITKGAAAIVHQHQHEKEVDRWCLGRSLTYRNPPTHSARASTNRTRPCVSP